MDTRRWRLELKPGANTDQTGVPSTLCDVSRGSRISRQTITQSTHARALCQTDSQIGDHGETHDTRALRINV